MPLNSLPDWLLMVRPYIGTSLPGIALEYVDVERAAAQPSVSSRHIGDANAVSATITPVPNAEEGTVARMPAATSGSMKRNDQPKAVDSLEGNQVCVSNEPTINCICIVYCRVRPSSSKAKISRPLPTIDSTIFKFLILALFMPLRLLLDRMISHQECNLRPFVFISLSNIDR